MPIPNHETLKVSAEEVREGDFIPGLDNAYVIETREEPVVTIGTGMAADLGRGMVLLVANDAEGDELYLVLPAEMPLTIEREVGK